MRKTSTNGVVYLQTLLELPYLHSHIRYRYDVLLIILYFFEVAESTQDMT